MGIRPQIGRSSVGPEEDPATRWGALADPRFLTYLQKHFVHARQERLHVVYWSDAHRYLHDETLMTGGQSSLVLRARPLVQRALGLGARRLVLAHNHLSGICRPSEEDIAATRRLQCLVSQLDLDLADHLIFTRDRAFSMRRAGLL